MVPPLVVYTCKPLQGADLEERTVRNTIPEGRNKDVVLRWIMRETEPELIDEEEI